MYKLLSYPIYENDPGWPGNFKAEITENSSIAKGDIANTYMIRMLNHFGSHMDGPRHFNDDGARLSELPLSTFIYEKPLLLDLPMGELGSVTAADLQPHAERIRTADLLMMRSGFAAMREENPEAYAQRGPSVAEDACRYLIDEHPQLKAIAMDWLSLATPSREEETVRSHQILLGKYREGRFICIIEDLNLQGLEPTQLHKVIALPLFMEKADSSPVTVIAETGGSES
jgi:arylformamidase